MMSDVRAPSGWLGQVFNFKLGRFVSKQRFAVDARSAKCFFLCLQWRMNQHKVATHILNKIYMPCFVQNAFRMSQHFETASTIKDVWYFGWGSVISGELCELRAPIKPKGFFTTADTNTQPILSEFQWWRRKEVLWHWTPGVNVIKLFSFVTVDEAK